MVVPPVYSQRPVSKPWYQSNPISAHQYLLLSQPLPDLCTFIYNFFLQSSFHFLHLYIFIFALLCFLCCCFRFCNIYTEHVRTCRSPHHRCSQCDVHTDVCLCGHIQPDVLRYIGPHSVRECILNWIFFYWTQCARDRDKKEKGVVHLKHNLTWKVIWKTCCGETIPLQWVLYQLEHRERWTGVNQKIYCNFLK